MDNEPKYIEGEPEEEKIRSSTSHTTTYLVNLLKKKKIALELVVDTDKINLLANLMRDYREYSGRSVNYVCFLCNYFGEQELCNWPGKTEILEKLKKNLPKGFQT